MPIPNPARRRRSVPVAAPTVMYAPPAKVGQLTREYLDAAFGHGGPTPRRRAARSRHELRSCVLVRFTYAPQYCCPPPNLLPPSTCQPESPPPSLSCFTFQRKERNKFINGGILLTIPLSSSASKAPVGVVVRPDAVHRQPRVRHEPRHGPRLPRARGTVGFNGPPYGRMSTTAHNLSFYVGAAGCCWSCINRIFIPVSVC